MDPLADDELSPTLIALEDSLARNHDEFMELAPLWTREWQRAINRRAMRRRRALDAQTQQNAATGLAPEAA